MDLEMRDISQKWFAAATPTNFAESTASIGGGADGTIAITKHDLNEDDAGYTVAILEPVTYVNMSAALISKVLTVTLGTSNSAAAHTTLGTGADGVIAITADAVGIAGNDYTVVVVEGTPSSEMSASLAGKDITVTLAMTEVPALDATKNTATLIKDAIHALTGVSAIVSGNGATPISSTVLKKNFTGGLDIALDATKNTATKIATAITALPLFTAVASGNGTTAITAAATANFTDGSWGTPCPVSGTILKGDTYHYWATKADNTKFNNGWVRFIPENY